MVAFVSDEWLHELAERGRDLPDAADVALVCQYEIAGAPDGKVRFFTVCENGRLTEVSKGKHPEPDCLVTAKAGDALAVLRGEVELEVSFMQGRVKIDGDYRRLLIDLRDWRTSSANRALWDEMAALTD